MKKTIGPFSSAEDEVAAVNKKHLPKENKQFAFTDVNFLLRKELRPVRIQLELLKPELILSDKNIHHALAFFGSARIPDPEVAEKQLAEVNENLKKNPQDTTLQNAKEKAERIYENSTYLKEATKLASIASTSDELDLVVFTGGGPSFMEAANKGAHLVNKQSVSLNIFHPKEQAPNPHVTPELTFVFHYFSIRKMHLLIRAKAIVAFPGGFGTLDEVFETLTLIQTQKIKPIPLILFNQKFWKRIINFQGLVEEGTISQSDLDFIKFAETAEEAWHQITGFYNASSGNRSP